MNSRRTAIRLVIGTAALIAAGTLATLFLVQAKPAFGWITPFGVGFALVLYGSGGILRSLYARHWKVVCGTVISSELREIFVPEETGGRTEYVPAVQTRYSTTEGTYVTGHYSLVHGDFRGDRARTAELLEHYPVGAVVDVYVNPNAPKLACLIPTPSKKMKSQYLAAIIGGLLVTMIALWVYAQGKV